MTQHTIIETPGGERLVLVPLADYEALVARLEEAEEDAADVAAYDAAKAADDGGRQTVGPDHLRGHYLRFRRKAAGMTQSQLATETGLAQGYISDLESGRRNPSEDAIARLASALSLTAAEVADLRKGFGFD